MRGGAVQREASVDGVRDVRAGVDRDDGGRRVVVVVVVVVVTASVVGGYYVHGVSGGRVLELGVIGGVYQVHSWQIQHAGRIVVLAL